MYQSTENSTGIARFTSASGCTYIYIHTPRTPPSPSSKTTKNIHHPNSRLFQLSSPFQFLRRFEIPRGFRSAICSQVSRSPALRKMGACLGICSALPARDAFERAFFDLFLSFFARAFCVFDRLSFLRGSLRRFVARWWRYGCLLTEKKGGICCLY